VRSAAPYVDTWAPCHLILAPVCMFRPRDSHSLQPVEFQFLAGGS